MLLGEEEAQEKHCLVCTYAKMFGLGPWYINIDCIIGVGMASKVDRHNAYSRAIFQQL